MAITACAVPVIGMDTDETDQKLLVVATTSIVGDVVRQIGKDAIELVVMTPIGSDPHAYQPTPADIASVADADVVFINGAGLELFLDDLLLNAVEENPIISVSDGIDFLEGHEPDHDDDHAHNDNDNEHDHDDEHAHKDEQQSHTHEVDPHVWMDPVLVKIWADNIAETLATLDPENAETYMQNAEIYQDQLDELDTWIQTEIEKIQPENRLIVMDHLVTGYFSSRYGFKEAGAVIPSFSTLAEPSAQELADLIQTISQLNVKAIFISETVSSNLAERIADDTGTQLVYLYHGSLSDADGPAANYLDFMRYNVNAIVAALQ